jgi:hypothetical protein
MRQKVLLLQVNGGTSYMGVWKEGLGFSGGGQRCVSRVPELKEIWLRLFDGNEEKGYHSALALRYSCQRNNGGAEGTQFACIEGKAE